MLDCTFIVNTMHFNVIKSLRNALWLFPIVVLTTIVTPTRAADKGTTEDSVTASGAELPRGWGLKISDRFGTDDKSTVHTMAELHAKYYESQFYSRDKKGLVRLPNVVINKEQQTYSHFETAIVFA